MTDTILEWAGDAVHRLVAYANDHVKTLDEDVRMSAHVAMAPALVRAIGEIEVEVLRQVGAGVNEDDYNQGVTDALRLAVEVSECTRDKDPTGNYDSGFVIGRWEAATEIIDELESMSLGEPGPPVDESAPERVPTPEEPDGPSEELSEPGKDTTDG